MKNYSVTAFVLDCLKPFKWLIAGQFVIAFIWAIDLSLRPYILKIIFDKIPTLTPAAAVTELSALFTFYLSMSILITFVFRFYDYTWLKLNPSLKRHIGDALMEGMMDHSQTLFQNHFAGSLSNKIKDVMSGVPDLLRTCINDFFARFLAFFIAVFTVWTISATFAVDVLER